MKLLLFALIFTSTAWAAICEEEMKPVLGILRVIESSLKLGDLTPDEVEAALLNGEVRYPFASRERTTKNLYFRLTFAKHWLRLKSEHLEPLRDQVRPLVNRYRRSQVQVAGAKEKTRYVFAVTPTHSLPFRQSTVGFTQGTLAGRPVIAGKLFDGVNIAMYLMDPTNPNFMERFVRLGERLDEEDQSASGFFFSMNGRDYYMRIFDNITYDLQSRMAVPNPIDPRVSNQEFTLGLLHLPASNRAVWARYPREESTEVKAQIQSWDISTAPPKLETLRQPPPPTSVIPYASSVDGRSIVGIAPKGDEKTMLFYDYSLRPHLFSTVQLDAPNLRFLIDAHPLTYALNGHWFALSVIYDEQTKEYAIGRFSLNTGRKPIQILPMPDFNLANLYHIKNETVNGEAVAVLLASSRLCILRLRDLNPLWQSADEFITHVKLFPWQNKTYLMYTTMDGELIVRNLPAGDLITSTKFPGAHASEFFIYEHDGILKALVTFGPGQNPMYVDLLHAEER